jgi:glycosyltransferase involved in cell wall biosynthesis
MKSIRVGYIIGGLGLGGAERELVNQVKSLSKAGVSCVVFTFGDGCDLESEIQPFAPVIHIGGNRHWGRVYRVERVLRLLEAVRRFEVNLLHSQIFYTNLYAWAVGKIARIPAIGSIQNDVYSEIAGSGIWGMPSFRWPSWMTVNSKPAYHTALKLGRSVENTFLLENALDLAQFDALAARAESFPQEKQGILVVSVGNLRKQKRHDVLLEAIAIARKSVPNLKCWIIGEGPLRHDLEQRAQSLGLLEDGGIQFLGKRRDVPALLRLADIFVLASDHEGYPNAVQEALAAGLPVVATRVGAVPDMIKDGENGFLVSAGDYNQLAERIAYLASQPSERVRMGLSARKYAEENFSLERLCRDLMGIYNHVLGKSGFPLGIQSQ